MPRPSCFLAHRPELFVEPVKPANAVAFPVAVAVFLYFDLIDFAVRWFASPTDLSGCSGWQFLHSGLLCCFAARRHYRRAWRCLAAKRPFAVAIVLEAFWQ